MNDKLCKRLRKTAREMTVGMPDRELIWVNQYQQLVNIKKSTRGVYLFLKKTLPGKMV